MTRDNLRELAAVIDKVDLAAGKKRRTVSAESWTTRLG
jgi:hypothetical protein